MNTPQRVPARALWSGHQQMPAHSVKCKAGTDRHTDVARASLKPRFPCLKVVLEHTPSTAEQWAIKGGQNQTLQRLLMALVGVPAREGCKPPCKKDKCFHSEHQDDIWYSVSTTACLLVCLLARKTLQRQSLSITESVLTYKIQLHATGPQKIYRCSI